MLERAGWLDAAVILVMTFFIWYIGQRHKRRRSVFIQGTLHDSTRGQFLATRGPNAAGFAGKFVAAPDPFHSLEVIYYAYSVLDPVDIIFSLFGRYRNHLVLRGQLAVPAQAELVWKRGQHPSVVLGNQPGDTLWSFEHVDFAGMHCATRGSDTQALKHEFTDLITRFGVAIRSLRIQIQRDKEPAVELLVYAGSLNIAALPSLVAAICTIGRAAK